MQLNKVAKHFSVKTQSLVNILNAFKGQDLQQA